MLTFLKMVNTLLQFEMIDYFLENINQQHFLKQEKNRNRRYG